jgi:hypothetical protein
MAQKPAMKRRSTIDGGTQVAPVRLSSPSVPTRVEVIKKARAAGRREHPPDQRLTVHVPSLEHPLEFVLLVAARPLGVDERLGGRVEGAGHLETGAF